MTQPAAETVLCYLPGEGPTERLAVVCCGGQRYELRQQSWGNGLGWFTQSSVTIDANQAKSLRNVLGANPITVARGGRHSHLRVVGD